MGRMKELFVKQEEARGVATRLLEETKYDLHAAYALGWKRVRAGLLDVEGEVLCTVVRQIYAEREPLGGVMYIAPEDREPAAAVA
jgi:hypothetical protein